MRRWLHPLILLGLVGCGDDVGTEVLIIRSLQADRLDPAPSLFRTLYAETEQCLGLEGDFDAVQWWTIDWLPSGVDQQVLGRTYFPNTIVIVRSYIFADAVVRHEMVHQITQLGDELHDANGNIPCDGRTA